MPFVKGQRAYWKGKKMPLSARVKMSIAKKGGRLSLETRKKIGLALLGRKRDNKTILKTTGTNHYAWKGVAVGYRALHVWVSRHKGTPKICENCKDNTAHRYHWANKSKEYRRELSDWIRLCPKCHYRYDEVHKKGLITKRKLYVASH